MWKYNLRIHWNMDFMNYHLQIIFMIKHIGTLSEFILGCTNCFCPFCGFFKERSKTPTTKEYQTEIQEINNNLSKVGGLTSLGDMTVNTTYPPFIEWVCFK